MKSQEISKKSEAELKRTLIEFRNKLAKLRFDISGKQTKNHRELRKVKKEIARVLTSIKTR